MRLRLFLLLSILTVTTAWGQTPNVVEKVSDVLARVPRLRIALVLGQDRMLPGDTSALIVAVYDAAGKIFTRRQVLELELVNASGSVVHRQHVLVASGTADTYLAVPSSLPAGAYMLRAYTEFMKNYGEHTFFRKEIEVLSDRLQRRAPVQTEISVHAEGGNLIAGVSNRLILKYKSVPLGSPLEVSGNISGAVVRAFATAGGVSEVTVKPMAGELFTVRIPAIAASPEATIRASGGEFVALRLDNRSEERRLVAYIPPAAGLNKRQLVALAVGNGLVIRLQRTGGNADSVRFAVPAALQDGIYQAIIFDDDARELAHRFFEVSREPVSAAVEWSVSNPSFRQDVQATVRITDNRGNPVQADVNIHLTDQRALLSENILPVQEWLPGLDATPDMTPQERDLLLAARNESWLPAGWNSAGYQPPWSFRSVIRFSGSVKRNNGLPLRDSTTIMLFLQNRMLGYEVDIRDGRFEFPVLFDFRGNDRLFYVVHRKDSLLRDVRIRFDMDTTSSIRPAALQTQYARDPYTDYATRRRTTDRSYRFFTSSSAKVLPEEPSPNARFESELRGTDITIRIDDYVVFPTVEDVVREIVPSLKHRRIGGRDAIRVFLYSPVVTNDPILSSGDPLYIIDGQMTLSTEYFMKIDPADLISISIVRNVNKLQHFGYLGKNGVVLVRTRKPQVIRSFQSNTVTEVQGFNLEWKETSGIAADPRIPDLRTGLSRLVQAASDDAGRIPFSFRTGDMSGTWLIRVDGVTRTGIPFHHVQRLEITGTR